MDGWMDGLKAKATEKKNRKDTAEWTVTYLSIELAV